MKAEFENLTKQHLSLDQQAAMSRLSGHGLLEQVTFGHICGSSQPAGSEKDGIFFIFPFCLTKSIQYSEWMICAQMQS